MAKTKPNRARRSAEEANLSRERAARARAKKPRRLSPRERAARLQRAREVARWSAEHRLPRWLLEDVLEGLHAPLLRQSRVAKLRSLLRSPAFADLRQRLTTAHDITEEALSRGRVMIARGGGTDSDFWPLERQFRREFADQLEGLRAEAEERLAPRLASSARRTPEEIQRSHERRNGHSGKGRGRQNVPAPRGNRAGSAPHRRRGS